jgi:CubicO group peptidase (beta-lactamase class C family)
MRKRWYCLTIVPLLAAVLLSARELQETPLPASVRSDAEFTRFLDASLPGWLARYRVPGVCVGTVSPGRETLRCYGTPRAGSGLALDGASRFGVASVSKTFASLAVLTLAGEGAFSLDDPVERHLRAWRFPRRGMNESNATIRQLLTHTAGAGVPSYGGAGSPAAGETTLDVLDGRGAGRDPVALITPPGSGFRYSGGGYMVLQLLVEDVSGLPFERFAAERIFRPLGMNDTSFSWGPARETDAVGHDVAGAPLARRSYGAAMAPGAMVTTGADMLRFTSAFASSRLPALLAWPQPSWEELVAPAHDGYGMALVVGKANGHVLVGHSGTTMGYNAAFTTMPAEGVGWFILENGNAGPYLKADIDRLFMEWRTGSIDARYRLMQGVRAVAAFFGTALTGLGIVLLAFFFAAFAADGRAWVLTSRVGRLGSALRLSAAVSLVALVAFWIVFFHTDAFYPAFTTAWAPFAFRYVTLGVTLLSLRVELSCAFVRQRT